MNRLIFGGLVVIILLGLYAYSVVVCILAVQCLTEPGCQTYTKDLNEGVVTVLNLVGGLVSALVVAELAVTDPAQAPGAAALTIDVSATMKKAAAIVTAVYILCWIVLGLASVIVGYIQHPNVVPALTASAKSWLGLAVAAAYAYLGVKRT